MRPKRSKLLALIFMLAALIPVFAYMAVFAAVAMFDVRSDFLMQAGRVLIWPVLIIAAAFVGVGTVDAFIEWSEMK